jgi:nucleoid-associated protein YgaU
VYCSVTSSGKKSEPMANETKKPDFSGVQSGVESTASAKPASAKADFSNVASGVESTANQVYTVVAGDNLSKIAKHFYGRPDWQRIYDANRDTLSDPDRIRVGQTLTIPPEGD